MTFRIDIFFFTDQELFAEFVLGKDESYTTPGMSEWLKELGLADNLPCVKLEKGFESSILLSASSRLLENLSISIPLMEWLGLRTYPNSLTYSEYDTKYHKCHTGRLSDVICDNPFSINYYFAGTNHRTWEER